QPHKYPEALIGSIAPGVELGERDAEDLLRPDGRQHPQHERGRQAHRLRVLYRREERRVEHVAVHVDPDAVSFRDEYGQPLDHPTRVRRHALGVKHLAIMFANVIVRQEEVSRSNVYNRWQRTLSMEQKVAVRQLFGAAGQVVDVEVGVELQDERIRAEFLVSWEYAQMVTGQPEHPFSLLKPLAHRLSGRLPPRGAGRDGFEGELADADAIPERVGPGRPRLAPGVGEHLAQGV